MNPLIPTAFDVSMTTIAIISLVLSVAALVSMIRSRLLSGWSFVAWTLAIFFIPIVGASAWFIGLRRHTVRTDAPE